MYTKILHATDLQENHYELCKKAVEFAADCKAPLYLLHVIETPSLLQLAQGLGFAELVNPIKDAAMAVLTILGEALQIPPERQYIEIGSIKMHVLEKVNELDIDLIIMGNHTPDHLPAFLGSTAHLIMNHATCDVLTVMP